MSVSVDVNVLLYASDQNSAFNARSMELLTSLASGSDLLCIAWITVISYLRLSTHHSIFAHPLSPEEAMRNVESLLQLPHVRLLSEDEGFWDIYRDLTREFPVRGNLVSDAHLATLLRQHGVATLYTNDADFRKFRFLQVRNPFEVENSGS